MLQALQVASRDRQHEAKVLAGKDDAPHYRSAFTVEGFSARYGPYVDTLLRKESTLNLYGLIVLTNGDVDTSSDSDDSATSDGEEVEEAPKKKPMSMLEQLMAEERGEPVVQNDRPSPKRSTKKRKEKKEHRDEDKPEDLEIFAPYYDDEDRLVKVCKWYPADGLHRRPLEELLNMVHFAALARDDPNPSRVVVSDTSVGDEDDLAELSTKLQRLIAGYTTQSLCSLWEEERRGSSDDGAKPSPVFSPWVKPPEGMREVVAHHLTAPWSPPPSADLIQTTLTKLELVVATPLIMPCLALLRKRWVPEMEHGAPTLEHSTAAADRRTASISFFPTKDDATMAELAANTEVLRWKLIRSIVDNLLAETLSKHVRRLDQRVKKLGGNAQIVQEESAEGGAFPSSVVGYFPSDEHFEQSLQALRNIQKVSGSVSEASEVMMAALFWDVVLFDLERTSRRGGKLGE